jgi:hypothetical protein
VDPDSPLHFRQSAGSARENFREGVLDPAE